MLDTHFRRNTYIASSDSEDEDEVEWHSAPETLDDEVSHLTQVASLRLPIESLFSTNRMMIQAPALKRKKSRT